MGRLVLLFLFALSLCAADLKVGVARVRITPEQPIFMAGYAARKKPSEGVKLDLWAKALAFEDAKGGRAVIVTTDLIGLTRAVSDQVGAELEKRYQLRRAQLLLNSSHTHSGPVIRGNLDTIFDLTPDQKKAIQEYTQGLVEKLVTVAGAALADLQPAEVSLGHGTGTFAINRREMTQQGVKIGLNPQGPVDQDIPVIRVSSPDGKLRAVLFGYACHNTTLGANLFLLHSDYAGQAQKAVEDANPGATALFMLLCGGDANPNPRGTYALVEEHGKTLAGQVQKALQGAMKPVRGPVRTAFSTVELPFAGHSREQYEAELKSDNWYKQQRAKVMLRSYDERRPARSLPYPVQAVRFGKDLTVVALGGEVLVDYDLRIKKEFAAEDTIVAGYSNEVMAYIPSARVIREGGYEPVDSMIYYGHPGPFAESMEEVLMGAVKKTMSRVGRKN